MCPVCKKNMTEQDFGGVSVDVCKDGCKGIWFDWSELTKLDETNDGLGGAFQEALQFPKVNDENRGPISCPKCGIPLHRHLYKSSKEVNIDECYRCGGFFLDSGELAEVRDHHMSEQEQAAYLDKLVSNVPGYQQALRDQAKDDLRADALQHYTRFMRVSYFVTGK